MAKRKRKKTVRKFNPRALLTTLLGILVVALLGVGGYTLLSKRAPKDSNLIVLFDDGTIAEGVVLNGTPLSHLDRQEAREVISTQIAENPDIVGIHLQIGNRQDVLKAEDIGLETDITKTIEQAYALGRVGTMEEREEQHAHVRENGYALNLAYQYDMDNLKENIRAMADKINAKPIEPKVQIDPSKSGDKRITIIEGKPGIEVDVEQFVEEVYLHITEARGGTVTVPGTVKEPKYSAADLRENTTRISVFSTQFVANTTKTQNRKHNIVTISDFMNGAMVLPGETLSMNDTAGPRTDPKIWKESDGIENGVFTPQLGGGICQASTTLFNAAVLADMEIVERRPHSIPSTYIDKGRDAMITTGGADLKIKNKTDMPMYVVMYVKEDPTGNNTWRVYAEVYGQSLSKQNIKEITITAEVTETVPFDPTPVYVTDKTLVHKGRNEYRAELYKTYHYMDGTTKTETAFKSRYRSRSPRELDPKLVPTPTPPVEGTPTLPPAA